MRYCRPDMDIKWVVTIIAILVTTHCCNLQSSVSFSNFNFLLFNHIYHHCGLGRGPGVIIRQDCRGPVPLSWEPGTYEGGHDHGAQAHRLCLFVGLFCPRLISSPSGWEERHHL